MSHTSDPDIRLGIGCLNQKEESQPCDHTERA